MFEINYCYGKKIFRFDLLLSICTKNRFFVQTKLHSPSALEQRTQTLENQIDHRKQKKLKGHGCKHHCISASDILLFYCFKFLNTYNLSNISACWNNNIENTKVFVKCGKTLIKNKAVRNWGKFVNIYRDTATSLQISWKIRD